MHRDSQDKTWGRHAMNWGEIQEPQGRDGYHYVLNALPQTTPLKLLDIGCGTGFFCRLAAAKGIDVTGIDASRVSVDIAKQHLSATRFFTGNMEKLPFEDSLFDVVCGFNSFQYADCLERALLEAKRVLKIGGNLIILVWGNQALCEIAILLRSIYALLSFPAPHGPGAFVLSENQLLENALSTCGFSAITTTAIPAEWSYPDVETAVKGLMSLGALSEAIDQNGMKKTREMVLKQLLSYCRSDGTIVIKNQYKAIICKNK